MPMKKYDTVEAYMADQPEQVRVLLAQLGNCIMRAVPTAILKMNYGVPVYALVEPGKRDQQIMIGGYKAHIGFYPDPSTIEAFKDRLSPYKFSKGTVQFPLDKPLPEELIVEMVKYRYEQILATD